MRSRAIYLVVCAIFLLVGCGGFIEAVTEFPFGSLAEPGPGFYSALVSALIAVTAVGCGLEVLADRTGDVIEWPSVQTAWRPIGLVAALVLAVFSLPLVGYLVVVVLLTFAIETLISARQWVRNAIFAVAFGVGTYYTFVTLLQVPLPRGVWFQ